MGESVWRGAVPLSWLALTASLALVAAAPPARGDALDDLRARGELVWGGDAEGGGPLIFPDEKNPNVMRGVEVDLAALLAQELGVKPRFQQGQWQSVPQMLTTRQIHLALNGYELTPANARDWAVSRPYYAYGLQLMTPVAGRLRDWADLRKGGPPARIGVLAGSAAELHLRALNKELPVPVEIVSFDGNTDPMTKAEAGALDGALQDDCVATFYADRFAKLRFAGRPVGGGFYVALVAPGEERLRAAIDRALDRLIADGRLEALYDRWKLGGRTQALWLRDPATVSAAARKPFADVVRDNAAVLLESAAMTVLLSVLSMPLAVALGILVAVGRLYGPWPIRWPLAVYVEVLRGTPLMLQLYFLYFLLPALIRQLGMEFDIPAMAAAVLGLALNYSAYEAEIYRAGLLAIPKGQMEAALALGMTRSQAVRRIVLPQAVRLVIPPVTNDFIALFKDTSVCSVVTIVELTKRYNILAMSTGAIVELATLTALLYLAMSYPLSLLARRAERRRPATA